VSNVSVTLNDEEMAFAAAVGVLRQRRRERAGHRNAHDSTGGVGDHILGARGELVYAKAADRYPSGLFLDIDQDDDVGGMQVRTRREHWHDLYVWNEDSLDANYALVTGVGPQFVYHGWATGREAKQQKFWREASKVGGFPRVSCFVVPREQLKMHR